MEEIVVSGKMPILALRGIVVFPNQTVHFDVAREKSVKAVEKAMDEPLGCPCGLPGSPEGHCGR